jgi:penicillin amidase
MNGRKTALIFVLFLFGCSSHPIRDIPQTDVVKNPALSAEVDVVRDQWGIPHIYGQSPADVAFAQGYVMAEDRLIQMDLARHKAAGTLSELLGDVAPSVIDGDIQMRVHHLRATVEAAWQTLSASTDDQDRVIARMLTSFAAGVNAYIADLQSQRYTLPPALAFLYDPQTVKPWTEVDSLLLGQLQAFSLSFDADSEIFRTQMLAAATQKFDQATNPALSARKGLGEDLDILQPVDPTYSLPSGWTGVNGDGTTASASRVPDQSLLALYAAARATVRGIGHDNLVHPSVGSNNWVVGPQLSASGHAMVANDTHLELSNPPIFYLVHLMASGEPSLDVMGVQFPGIPGVILGMNEHVAWGSTVNNIDITDVYQETVVPCDGGGGPCVMFNGAKVPLVPRPESFDVGRFGQISRTVTVTLYDVPHHGPIIPRITVDHAVEPLGSSELSIKYTGYEPAPRLSTVVYGLNTARTMKEAVAAIDSGFLYGNQNWVIGDDQGHFGWTQFTRTPRRAATAAPWKVLPGDGSAEWGGDMDPRYIPHAYDPAKGFIATANNDPIGVTDDGDPFFGEPMVDGAPLYLGADYDPGTRVGRITKRIEAATAGGGKLTLDDMQSIQADAVSEWAQALQPTFLATAQAVQEEIAQPGKYADLRSVVMTADAPAKSLVPTALALVQAWTSGDMASGVDEDAPTAPKVADAQAAAVMGVWMRRFADWTFEDELTELGLTPGASAQMKLLVRMCTHTELLKTGLHPMTGDPIVFDIWDTGAAETKRQVAAMALFDTLDYLYKALGPDPAKWRWGNLHTLTLSFLAPVDALQIPLKSDPQYPNGFPRHGDFGTVDVAGGSIDLGDYSYRHGPAIRFAAELDPKSGPRARNALPGGEVLDPASPHYRDLLELWRKNQTIDLRFAEDEVAASARVEYETNGIGRVRFQPR